MPGMVEPCPGFALHRKQLVWSNTSAVRQLFLVWLGLLTVSVRPPPTNPTYPRPPRHLQMHATQPVTLHLLADGGVGQAVSKMQQLTVSRVCWILLATAGQFQVCDGTEPTDLSTYCDQVYTGSGGEECYFTIDTNGCDAADNADEACAITMTAGYANGTLICNGTHEESGVGTPSYYGVAAVRKLSPPPCVSHQRIIDRIATCRLWVPAHVSGLISRSGSQPTLACP